MIPTERKTTIYGINAKEVSLKKRPTILSDGARIKTERSLSNNSIPVSLHRLYTPLS